MSHGHSAKASGRSPCRHRIVLAIIVIVAVAVAALFAAASHGTIDELSTHAAQAADTPAADSEPAAQPGSVVQARAVTTDLLDSLPQASTFTSVPAAPTDPAPGSPPTGTVVRPNRLVPGFAAPGGEPVVAIPAEQPIGLAPSTATVETWLPVLERQPGWVRIALPSRPNNSTAWLPVDPRITVAASPYTITVDVADRSMRLHHQGVLAGRWSIGVGAPGSATPTGRTYLLAAIRTPQAGYSPVLLVLGVHSAAYTTYSGGPGTVAIHGWPDPAVFGTATSDGCVRVPADALDTLTTANDGGPLPLETPVIIT